MEMQPRREYVRGMRFRQHNNPQQSLKEPILYSLAFHMLFFLSASYLHLVPAQESVTQKEVPIRVRLVKPPISLKPEEPQPKIERKQIVSPPTVLHPVEPKDTNKVSDVSSSTEKETIKRGETSKAVPNSPPPSKLKPHPKVMIPEPHRIQKNTPPSKQEGKRAQKPDKQDPLAKSHRMFLENSTLMENYGASVTGDNDIANKGEGRKKQNIGAIKMDKSYAPFMRDTGSLDLLPQVEEGSLTLLNAKAERYAVFVRRIALNVFGHLRALNWQTVSRGGAAAASQFVQIKAVLNSEGKLKSATITDSSGSYTFDQAALEAVNLGAWDRNIPDQVKDDQGNTHFIFESRIWSRPSPTVRGEERWILLSTGLL